jgi:inactivated superfamily I helicase
MDNEKAALELYEMILQTANRFLRNANMFELSALRDHNPSYDEIAKIMKELAKTITDLADEFDPMLGQKAIDYANCMHQMALAIRKDNEVELSNLVANLQSKPFC